MLIYFTDCISNLFASVTLSTDAVTEHKPFLQMVSEIAVDGEHLYTMDSTFNRIGKYTVDGEFLYGISFESYGESYIFINNDGILCRYDVRENAVFLYDDQGNVSEKRDMSNKEFRKLRSIVPVTQVMHSSVRYTYRDHLLLDSVVMVTDGNEQRTWVVESVWSHIVILAIAIAGIALFVSGAFHIYLFLRECKLVPYHLSGIETDRQCGKKFP